MQDLMGELVISFRMSDSEMGLNSMNGWRLGGDNMDGTLIDVSRGLRGELFVDVSDLIEENVSKVSGNLTWLLMSWEEHC